MGSAKRLSPLNHSMVYNADELLSFSNPKVFTMKKLLLFCCCVLPIAMQAQNVGVGTNLPTEKLDVNGNIKANGLLLNSAANPYDFLIKKFGTGEIGYRKGFGATAINYIICVNGAYPSSTGSTPSPWLGEIKMFAGEFPPGGWMFCHGQLLSISQNQALFSLLLFNYGGNGQTNFALPDLRGTAPVSAGTNPAGYLWNLGQRTD